MPRLPQASDLGAVNISPARSFVDIGTPDIAGAANAVARGLSDAGTAVASYVDDRRKKASAQERFDTKMALLKGEELYADETKDYDPLDPQHVEKKKQKRKDIFGPILQGVQDPENRQWAEESTYVDYVNIGINATKEHKVARGKKQAIDLDTYVDGVRKGVRAKTYTGDPVADITQMVNDSTDIDEVTKQEILPKYLGAINGDQFDTEFETIATGGVSVTSSVKSAVTKAVAGAGPDAPSWLGDYLLRAAAIESRGGRMKVNQENPQVGGTWQIDDDTAPELGLSLDDRFDDEKAAVGVTKLAMRDYKLLKETLGRDPTPAELYLAHQQGIGGGPKLLANPDKKAVDVVGKKAVEQNLPASMRGKANSITAGQFAEYIMRKFDGQAGGAIDPDDTLETLRLTDSYQNMTADEQAAAEKNVLTRIKSVNDEAAKDTELNTARSAADFAVENFGTREEGTAWIKANVADPQAREKALTMHKADVELKTKSDEAAYKDAFGRATVDVVNAVNSGDINAAFKAIPAGLEGDDILKLQKIIEDGPVQVDDTRALGDLNYLKYGTEDERKQFAEMDLRTYIGRLKPSTYEALFKEQQSIKKQYDETGSAPSLAEPAKILNDRLLEIGIDTKNTKGAELVANLRAERQIKTILDANLKLATEKAGRKLAPDELQRVMDDTFIEFSRKEKNTGWTGGEYNDVQVTLPTMITEFSAIEEVQGLPPGSLLQQAIDYHAQEYESAKKFVNDQIRALQRLPDEQQIGADAQYRKLAEAQVALEDSRVDPLYLYNWLENYKKEQQ